MAPEVRFQNQPTGNNEGYLEQKDMLDEAYDFDGTIQLTGKASHSISARSMLQAGHFRYWLRGPDRHSGHHRRPQRTQRRTSTQMEETGNPLHPIFEAWFYPSVA